MGTQATFINLRVSYNTVTNSELVYATGFDRAKFDLIFKKLERQIPDNIICVKKDALLVTLYMLRHNMCLKMIDFIFGISRKLLSEFCSDLVKNLLSLLNRNELWDKTFRDSRPFQRLRENIESYQKRCEDISSDGKVVVAKLKS